MALVTLSHRITELLESQLPGFLRQNSPGFTAFMEAYYEWMESEYAEGKYGAYYASKSLLDLTDIDLTLTDFEEYFYKEFLGHIPRSVICNKHLLLKHIKDFYRSRGCEKSYKLLFKIMFGEDDIEFYYPTVDILRPDDGDWEQLQSMRCRAVHQKYTDTERLDEVIDFKTIYSKTQVRGAFSFATAYVNDVIDIYDRRRNCHIYELVLEKNSIKGEFLPYEIIQTYPTWDTDEYFQVLPVLTEIQITAPGENYTEGEVLAVHVNTEQNLKFNAQITQVDNITGGVEWVSITNQGLGIFNLDTSDSGELLTEDDYNGKFLTEDGYVFGIEDLINVVFPTRSSQAAGTPVFGAVFTYDGKYNNANGFPDDIKKLRDDYYYQEFSYQISTNHCFNQWIDVIRKLVHPVGSIPFCDVRIESSVTSEETTTSDFDNSSEIDLIHINYSGVPFATAPGTYSQVYNADDINADANDLVNLIDLSLDVEGPNVLDVNLFDYESPLPMPEPS